MSGQQKVAPAGRYTKISKAGKILPAGAKDWAVVHDAHFNLFWLRRPSRHDSWKEAIAAAAKVKAAGFSDWRAPTRVELLALVDDTRYGPAIDTDFFTCPTDDWYWSSTPAAYSPSVCAWYVNFGNGLANWSGQDNSGFVRAVRAGQLSDLGSSSAESGDAA